MWQINRKGRRNSRRLFGFATGNPFGSISLHLYLPVCLSVQLTLICIPPPSQLPVYHPLLPSIDVIIGWGNCLNCPDYHFSGGGWWIRWKQLKKPPRVKCRDNNAKLKRISGSIDLQWRREILIVFHLQSTPITTSIASSSCSSSAAVEYRKSTINTHFPRIIPSCAVLLLFEWESVTRGVVVWWCGGPGQMAWSVMNGVAMQIAQ